MSAQNPISRSRPRAYVAARAAASAARTKAPLALLIAALVLGLIAAQLPRFSSANVAHASGLRVGVFVLALVALYFLLLAVSVGVTGRANGVFWSSRNTYSLSRLQVALWTWLILSALLAVVICRAWGGLNAPGASGLAAALDIEIPIVLLQVMGISFASGAAAPAILSLKAEANRPPTAALNAAATRLGAEVNAVGKVFVRTDSCPPLFRDLFQSDDAAAAGTVDISKVQQFIVTLILWSVYFAMLFELFYAGAANSLLPGNKVDTTTHLPPFSSTFVYLLAISHAGYLAYKAVPVPPSTDGGTGTASPSRAVGQPAGGPARPSTVLQRPPPPTGM